jgi:hypothetical protein
MDEKEKLDNPGWNYVQQLLNCNEIFQTFRHF